ncbi:hypothetical protein Elgi_71260 [Paenibacillus elgii]|uniref:flagellar filament capping protein FliD n=1 Tax=Paenibacillus elgii TaxID=189691 RepID=UPI002D7D43A6|nr:hypothetical protein Elgi_71260 [Paenibacillus elgii]
MVTRVSGIGSGMNIEDLVTKLMQAERAPLNKLSQKQQSLTWKTQAYRDINVKLSAFRDSISTLRFGSGWGKTKATSSNESLVSVTTATTTAITATRKIVVNSLAQTGSLHSSAQISNAGLASSGPVTDYNIDGTNNQFKITLNGVSKTITIPNGSYTNNIPKDSQDFGDAIQKAVDSAFGANQIKVQLDKTTNVLSLSPAGSSGFEPQLIVNSIANNGGLAKLGLADGQAYKFDVNAKLSSQTSKIQGGVNFNAGTFTINGQTISVDPNSDSLSSIITKVNNSAAGVTMSYDSIADRITINTKNTGANATIEFSNDSSNFLQNFKLGLVPKAGDPGNYENYTPGQNAKVVIDGIGTEYTSNSFTNNGINYNLRNVTDANGVTINASPDNDATFNIINDFVKAYNDLLGSINTLLNEPKYRSYQPLTSDQKDAMKEDEIKKWEEKAKSGLLADDIHLSKIRDSLRETAYSTISDLPEETNALFKIGITTKPFVLKDYANNGKLQIDQTALKDAIAKDSQAVINLFTKVSASNTPSDKGIMQQMYESATNMITNIMKTAGNQANTFDNVSFTLGEQINSLNRKMGDWKNKLTKKEDYYYKMFSRMDTAIAKSNSQMSWLQSKLG